MPAMPPNPPDTNRSNMSAMSTAESGQVTVASSLPQSALAGARLIREQSEKEDRQQTFAKDLRTGFQIDQEMQRAFADDLKVGSSLSLGSSVSMGSRGAQYAVQLAFDDGIKAMRQEQQALLQQFQDLIRGHSALLQGAVEQLTTNVVQPEEKMKSNDAEMGNGIDAEMGKEPQEVTQSISRRSVHVAKKHQSLLARKIDLESHAMDDNGDDDVGALLQEMQALNSKDSGKREKQISCYDMFQMFVLGDRFELTFGVIILVNTVVMAVDMQYTGENQGADINAPMTSRPAGWLGDLLNVVNEFLLWAFVIELVSKLAALRLKFFTTNRFFNWMDILVVVSGVIDRFFTMGVGVDPLILRLLRMLKLTRILKMFKVQSALHTMNYIMKAVDASKTTLCWSMICVFMIQVVAGMFLGQLASIYIKDEENSLAQRQAVYEYYGTFVKAQFTMFEVTHANYSTAARVLTANVSEWWVLFFVTYRVCISFAFMQVVRAIFIQSTLKVADRDRDLMLHNKKQINQQTTQKLGEMFSVLAGAEGELYKDTFLKACKLDATKIWFSAIDIDLCDPPGMWELLDLNGDGSVTCKEFSVAAAKLRGTAQTLDLYCLQALAERIETKLDTLLPHEFRGHVFIE